MGDGFALTAAGASADFRAVAADAEVCDVPVERMALAAVHPWDVDGARRAGLRGIHIDRRATPYPTGFLAPDLVVPDFEVLAAALAG